MASLFIGVGWVAGASGGVMGVVLLLGGGRSFLLWCGWVFCVRMVVHSLFGLVTMLRFFSVLHIGLPLLAFRAGGGFLYPGGDVELFLLVCGVLVCLVGFASATMCCG